MADSALPPPADLEYKSTKDTVIGPTPAAVPHIVRTGTALTEEERRAADQVVGSPAQGNGVPNDNMAPLGGVATDTGGTQDSSTLGDSQSESPSRSRRQAAKED